MKFISKFLILTILLILISTFAFAQVWKYDVPLIDQKQFDGIAHSAGAATCVKMVLDYYFPENNRSWYSVPILYDMGIKKYSYEGPFKSYKQIGFEKADLGLSTIENKNSKYYHKKDNILGLDALLRFNFNIESKILRYLNQGTFHGIVAGKLKRGPVIASLKGDSFDFDKDNVYDFGLDNYWVVFTGYDDKDTETIKDDVYYISDPYNNIKNMEVDFNFLYKSTLKGNNFISMFVGEGIFIKPPSDKRKNVTLISFLTDSLFIENVNSLIFRSSSLHSYLYFNKENKGVISWNTNLKSGKYKLSLEIGYRIVEGYEDFNNYSITYKLYNDDSEVFSEIYNFEKIYKTGNFIYLGEFDLSEDVLVTATNIAPGITMGNVYFEYQGPIDDGERGFRTRSGEEGNFDSDEDESHDEEDEKEQRKEATLNQKCSSSIKCEEKLECISTSSWWNFWNSDGVCCSEGSGQEDGKCVVELNQELENEFGTEDSEEVNLEMQEEHSVGFLQFPLDNDNITISGGWWYNDNNTGPHSGVDYIPSEEGDYFVTSATPGIVLSPVYSGPNYNYNFIDAGEFSNISECIPADRTRAYGQRVMVEYNHNEENYTIVYGHLEDISVDVGDQIDAGTIIGTLGNTGCSSGRHLHFEIRDAQNNKVDPYDIYAGPSSYPVGQNSNLECGADNLWISCPPMVQDNIPEMSLRYKIYILYNEGEWSNQKDVLIKKLEKKYPDAYIVEYKLSDDFERDFQLFLRNEDLSGEEDKVFILGHGDIGSRIWSTEHSISGITGMKSIKKAKKEQNINYSLIKDLPNLNQIEHLMLMTCFTAEDPYDKVRNVEGVELEPTIIEAFLKAGVGQVEASAGPVEYNNPWYFWKTSYALESPEDFNRFFLYDGKINNNKETLISEIYK